MQHIYSFCGSPIHLMLEDDVADAYNRVASLTEADLKVFNISNGETKHVLVAEEEDVAVYNAIADIINKLCEINGGTIHLQEEDLPYNKFVLV